MNARQMDSACHSLPLVAIGSLCGMTPPVKRSERRSVEAIKADDHHISSQQTTILLFIQRVTAKHVFFRLDSNLTSSPNHDLSVRTITWAISPMFGHAHENDYRDIKQVLSIQLYQSISI